MALVKAKERTSVDPIAEKIQRRRLQMLVHSYLYYDLNTSLITDHQWQEWANELAELQKQYPEVARKVRYAKEFEGWDGSTGFHLPYRQPNIMRTAEILTGRW